MIDFGQRVSHSVRDVMFDPQTSGGLLISVGSDHADAIVKALRDAGIGDTAEIGEVLKDPKEKIWVV
ncbi:MAG: hypothetical protein LJE66_05460 [Desulfobacterales bacterium]|jgi:selenide,water dikinase|nr:hypothetical protein [Desulfobacterales bacterium]